jgi:hypothetical protein
MSAPVETIHLGFEVGTGKPVSLPLRNLAITGQTQESGKTTTLEALAGRSGATVLTFITKRGEGAFESVVHNRVRPYFRDRADWQFVDAIMAAALAEQNKFLRQFLIPICRLTRTLGEVQEAVRAAMPKAHGQRAGALVQLDAYLELIVPEIQAADLAPTLNLRRGLNVMDVRESSTPMQMLFVQSALDYVNEHCRDTIVVIPEAWEFIPEGKGSPVKKSATALVRKGSGIGNRIWVDSQDMAGVDKVILRGCPVWLVGVQREANEIKRNLANIPPPTGRPKAGDVAMLERGQFFACFGTTRHHRQCCPHRIAASRPRQRQAERLPRVRQAGCDGIPDQGIQRLPRGRRHEDKHHSGVIMADTEYALGPWEAVINSDGSFEIWADIGKTNPWVICSRNPVDHRAKQSRSNGFLIGAAPDLLKALEAACGYLLNAKIDLETGCPKTTAIRTIEGGLSVVRAAIAKAKGEAA